VANGWLSMEWRAQRPCGPALAPRAEAARLHVWTGPEGAGCAHRGPPASTPQRHALRCAPVIAWSGSESDLSEARARASLGDCRARVATSRAAGRVVAARLCPCGYRPVRPAVAEITGAGGGRTTRHLLPAVVPAGRRIRARPIFRRTKFGQSSACLSRATRQSKASFEIFGAVLTLGCRQQRRRMAPWPCRHRRPTARPR
jgi:hypothetical protein